MVSCFCFEDGQNLSMIIFRGKQPITKEKMRDGRSARAGFLRSDRGRDQVDRLAFTRTKWICPRDQQILRVKGQIVNMLCLWAIWFLVQPLTLLL